MNQKNQNNKKPEKQHKKVTMPPKKKVPSLEDIKTGAIVKATQECILDFIKSDAELSQYADQRGIRYADMTERIAARLEDDSVIVAQKFNIFNEDGTAVPIISWSPCSIKDYYKVFGIEIESDTSAGYEEGYNPNANIIPSFLGKNIKSAFHVNGDVDSVTKLFIDTYIDNEDFTLANTVYYQLYVDIPRKNDLGLHSIKVKRNSILSPRRAKQ